MNKKFITIILMLTCRVGYGQISTWEEPVSFSMELPALKSGERTHKVMPSIDLNRMEQEDREREARRMINSGFQSYFLRNGSASFSIKIQIFEKNLKSPQRFLLLRIYLLQRKVVFGFLQ